MTLSEHIYSLVFTDRQELNAFILYCNWEIKNGGGGGATFPDNGPISDEDFELPIL